MWINAPTGVPIRMLPVDACIRWPSGLMPKPEIIYSGEAFART